MVAESFAEGSGGDGQERAEAEGHFYYFAYGSNLLAERIHVQIKGAEFVSIGSLADFQLNFYDHSDRWCGAIGSIDSVKNGQVWGCVWRVPNKFAEELDIQETGYHQLQVDIVVHAPNDTLLTIANGTSGGIIRCRTYQYSNPKRQPNPPSPHYKHVIMAGALEHNLPKDYRDWIHTNFADNGYRGSVKLNLKAIEHLNASHGEVENNRQDEPCGEGA